MSHHTDAALSNGDDLDVIVIGGGQAGLATGYHLARRGLRFLVVDAGPAIGHVWRSRWSSLRLFTPAEHDGLPGMAFPAPAGSHPDKDQVADYLEAYAAHFGLPVLLGCTVRRVSRSRDGFAVETSRGTLRARQVVVATGPFQSPVTPRLALGLDPDVTQVHSAGYRDPDDLPTGPVLVVGGGNSGRQIALELAASGERQVTLAVGTEPPTLPQRILGRDLFWWLTRLGLMAKTADSRLARRMQARGDIVVGSPLPALRRAGVDVRGRALLADGREVHLEDGAPVEVSAVVWATGFRTDYSWLDVPGVVVDGRVVHRRGLTDVPGLAFVGLPWQHTRGSALLGFVGDDAEFVVTALADAPRESPRAAARPA